MRLRLWPGRSRWVRALARCGVATAMAVTGIAAAAGPAAADNAWPATCAPRGWPPHPLVLPTAFPVWSVPTQPVPGEPVSLTRFGARPFGDGTILQTWEMTSPFVSAYDNAHGVGPQDPQNPPPPENGETVPPNIDGSFGGPTTPLTDPFGHVLPTPSTTIDFPSGARTVAAMPLRVNVLLPPDFDPTGHTRYPVLYLLGGSADDSGFSQFLWQIEAEPAVLAAEKASGHDVIVVMPDDSMSGNTFDWYGTNTLYANGSDVPAWESFFVRQLVPMIDLTYPTQRRRTGRAIAGLSSGGDAAMILAGHNPALFGTAAAFSGAVDNLADLGPYDEPTVLANLDAGYVPVYEGPDGLCAAGDPFPQDSDNTRAYWHWEDPVDLATDGAYAHTRLWLASGNGGDLGSNAELVEYATGVMTENFAAALAQAPDPRSLTRSWTAYNTGFPDLTGTTFPGATITATGQPNNCPVTSPRCVLVQPGGSHEKSYWQADLRSFLSWYTGSLR